MHREPTWSQDKSPAVLQLLEATAMSDGQPERRFVLLNRSREVWPYQIAALWQDGQVVSHSGAGQIDHQGPYAQWLVGLFKQLATHAGGALTAANVGAESAQTWHEWWPEYALLLRAGATPQAPRLLLVRDVPWQEQEAIELSRWFALWHVQDQDKLAAQSAGHVVSWQNLRARWQSGKSGDHRRAWIALACLIGILCLPVHLTVRAPVEIVPKDPLVLRAAVDGTVRALRVQPNQTVKAGQVLAELDDAGWSSRLQVAQQALLTADAEWRQVSQQALNDPKAKTMLASAQGRYEERKAEVTYLSQQVQRTTILAPHDGVVLVQDAGSWPGRTVAAGEAVMKLAQPQDQEVEAWLAAGDAIDLPIGSPMRVHLSSHPSSPLSAKLRLYAFEAEHRPDLGWGYRLRGTLDAGQLDRLGARGTVRIDGSWVPLSYWILRPPVGDQSMSAAQMPIWPALREELRLHHGASESNGQPTWTIQDPVRHRFIRIDWVTYEILRRWWMADPHLVVEDVNSHTTLQIESSDVTEVLALALREELVLPVQPPASQEAGSSGALKAGLRWALHHYLFFRIPLTNPDAVLAKLLPWVAWLGGTTFSVLTLLALLSGLLGAVQQSEALNAQWLDLLSWQGALLYGITLAGVKVAHELGHALVAKHEGCRVPTMGVAMMVLWPVAYTDTTEAWRLANPRARLRIAAAGVRTELTIAAWSSLAWAWLPDGALRTALFILATMTWVTSLFINLSPFMRFDGYFLLCDWLDEPNLHERSFAMARWWLRARLLGWDQEAPEEMAPASKLAMVLFALLTWSYRLSLYLGIAWMVYHVGFKALGIILFAVEVGWFILSPLWREGRIWFQGRSNWWGQARARQTGVALVLFGLIGFIPVTRHETGSALLQPLHHLALRLPGVVMIDELAVKPGQSVKAGQVLLRAMPAQLAQQLDDAQARVQVLEREVAMAAINPEQKGQWASLQGELATAREQVHTLQTELIRYQPTAPFDGTVVDLNPSLKAGLISPPSREVLMHLAQPGQWQVIAYASESTVGGLHPGDPVTVVTDASPLHGLRAHVVSMAPTPSAQLDEAILAQSNGGAIEAREAGGAWLPAQAIFRVEVALDEPILMPPRVWRGHVAFNGEAMSYWHRIWDVTVAAIVRETGF